MARYDILSILLCLGYHTNTVYDAKNSPSRCFVVAQPENDYPLNNVTSAREHAQ